MRFLYIFGWQARAIEAGGMSINARVTDVKTCWWLKINTKPIRTHAWDGAVFPHMVHFEYTVNGVVYKGKRYWTWRLTPPAVGQTLPMSCDPENPARHALPPR